MKVGVKMNKWIMSFFQIGRKPLMALFGKKRNGRGWIWGSLLSLGVSAAAIRLSRNKKMQSPVNNIMNNFDIGKMSKNFDIGKMSKMGNLAGLAEIAEELVPNKGPEKTN
jgi:hypothetical protein